ncbi:MAG: translocation/assembly module TamB domain-containing protein, partial [Candidatus Eremiobacteraeota bacterium]|nr:translocation/assembly module TamB domain-containing protein [Candidatus Eremiobacteraeota bacterium]
RFDGLVALADGDAGGYPVSGGADVLFADARATVRNGTAALGETFGDFAGHVDVGGREVALDLGARVPLGEIAELRDALRLPLRTLEGSFAADLRVAGTAARPRITGDVTASGGSFNGLAFRDGRASVALTRDAVSAQRASVRVGSTVASGDIAYVPARSAFAIDVRSPAADLADFDDYFDEAETLDGRGPIALAFANDGQTTRTTGRLDVTGLRFRHFALGHVRASWSQRAATVRGTLSVRGAHSALDAGGTVVPAPGPPIVAFERAFYRAGVRATGVMLSTWLPAFGIRAPILGQVDAQATVAGRYPRLALDAAATLRNGSIYGHAVQTGTLRARSDGAGVALSQAVLDVGFARFDVSGSLGPGRRDPLALAVHVQTADLQRALVALDPKSPRPDVGGALVADARIGGSLAAPRASLGFEATGARYRSLTIPHILGSVAYDGRTLTVNDAEATFARGSLLVAGGLPLGLHPLGVRESSPLSFTLGASALDLAPFAPFLPGPAAKLSGTVNGRVAVEGTVETPRVVGSATVADASYVSALDRAGISRASARLDFLGTSVALAALHANVGSGTIDGSGRLDLPFPGVHTSGYAIALNVRGARVDTAQFGRGTLDGALRLAGGAARPVLSGEVTLSNASIPILSVYRNVAAAAGIASGARSPFDIDLDLVTRAGRNVRIQAQNPFIDVGAAGTLDFSGTLLAPRALGTLVATPGGIFSTYNHAFRIQQGTVTFAPDQGISPTIDLRAYAHVTDPDPDPSRNAIGSADITVTVRGSADEIAAGSPGAITYASNPPYSEEQIAGLLLDASVFGAVNFGQQQNGTTLPGAPGESNALLPPGVTPYQSGIVNFNQEAFSILNGQLTQRFLAPLERVLSGAIGLSDLELTVDYGGGVGYNALKQIGRRDIYASLGQTLTSPSRTTLGFT